MAPLFWTSRLLSSKNADVGLYVVMGAVFGGMILSLGMMWGYRLVTPTGFMWFGPSVVVGFVVALGVLATVTAATMLKADGSTTDAKLKDETRS
jgi:hypothetical protein